MSLYGLDKRPAAWDVRVLTPQNMRVTVEWITLHGLRDLRVSIDGYHAEYMAQASRTVYVCEGLGVVIKFGRGGFGHQQNLGEAVVYHEHFDDEARTIAPAVLKFDYDAESGLSWVVQERVLNPCSRHNLPDYAPREAMQAFAKQALHVLGTKYGVRDTHDGNCGFAADGRFVMWDLGIGDGTYMRQPEPKSPFMQEVVSRHGGNLPQMA
jgi:hypothetical protein